MRKFRLIVIMLLILLALSLPAETGKGLFWKMQHKDVTMYFCGSVHLMKPEVYPLPQHIEAAFEESDIIAVEIDISKIDRMKLQKIIAEKAVYQDGKTLESELPPETYKTLETDLDSIGLKLEAMKNYRPWYLTLTLSSYLVTQLGYSPESGTEMYFLNKNAGKREVISLESAESQFQLLSDMPDDLQLSYLLDTVKRSAEFSQEVEKLMNSWLSGDADTMYKLICQEMQKDENLEKVYEKMFTERNIEMAEKLDDMLQNGTDKTYFVIVGSGHFLGEEGIISLLNNKGYTINRY